MRDRRPAISFLPSTGVLELTYRCNHACRFCSCPWYAPDGAFAQREELSLDAWRAIIDRLAAMGVACFAFTGGEPLLKPGAMDLVAHAATREVEHVEGVDGRLVSRWGPPRLILLSNGRALTEEVLDRCAALGVELSISLPGLGSFRDHTGGGEAAHVLRWLGAARARGITTTAGVTVTRENLDELYETLATALLAGADRLLVNRFLPGGRGLAHAGALALDADGVRRMCDIAEEVLAEAERPGTLGTEVPACLVDPARYRWLKVGTRCSAALDFFVVGPSGWVRVCNHSPIRLAHVDDLDAVRDHPEWRRFATRTHLPRACVTCASMATCDAGCREAARITSGAVDGPDPLLAGGG